MNGEEPQFTDAVGKPVPRPLVPPQVASPINLLNPDRYEFYTFDESGQLIKRLMTMKEIQSIVANGNGAMVGDSDSDPEQSIVLNNMPISNTETRVQDIVNNVQSVLSREIETKKNLSEIPSHFDTPDVSSSWSMILPAIFGNTGDEIVPSKPIQTSINMTPDSEVEEEPTKPTRFPMRSKTTTPGGYRSTTFAPTENTVNAIDLSLLNSVDTLPQTTTARVTKKPSTSTRKTTTKVKGTYKPSQKSTSRTTKRPSTSARLTTPKPASIVRITPAKKPLKPDFSSNSDSKTKKTTTSTTKMPISSTEEVPEERLSPTTLKQEISTSAPEPSTTLSLSTTSSPQTTPQTSPVTTTVSSTTK